MATEGEMMQGELVQLYCYDLSGGMARTFSQMLLGRQIEAIWHTSVVVGALEHYFGHGISVAPRGATPFGRPVQVLDLGYTQLPEDMRSELLADLSERYTPEAYSLFHNNCNNFSDEFAQLLCGQGVPAHITGLPAEVLATPFGQMIAPMLSGLEQQLRSMRQQQPYWPGASTAAAAAAPLPLPASLPADAVPAAAAGQRQQEQAALAQAPAAPVAATIPTPTAAAGAAAEQGQGAEGPALLAAEVEIEAAIAAGMMQEAEQKLHALNLQPGQHGGSSGGEAAATSAGLSTSPAAPPEPAGAEEPAKLDAELAVKAEFDRLMATGQVAEHEAQALALEVVAAQRKGQRPPPEMDATVAK